MKTKLFTLMVVLLTTGTLSAQTKSYLNVSGQAGFVVNSQEDRKLGLGGSAAWLQQDGFLFNCSKNYLTLTLKALNNPFREGRFVSSILNNKFDAFNYLGVLAGYRLTTGSAANGFYVEPRLGAGVEGSGISFLFSPAAGYAYKNFDFALYSDMGFAGKTQATGTDNFFTVGLSVGYNIGL